MILDNYADYDGLGLAELVRRKEVSPRDLVDSAIDVIERHNGAVNCVPQVQSRRDRYSLAASNSWRYPGFERLLAEL